MPVYLIFERDGYRMRADFEGEVNAYGIILHYVTREYTYELHLEDATPEEEGVWLTGDLNARLYMAYMYNKRVYLDGKLVYTQTEFIRQAKSRPPLVLLREEDDFVVFSSKKSPMILLFDPRSNVNFGWNFGSAGGSKLGRKR